MFVFVFTLQTRTYVVYSLLIHNSQLMPHAIFYLTTSARRTTHRTHRLICALHDILLLRKQASGSRRSRWRQLDVEMNSQMLKLYKSTLARSVTHAAVDAADTATTTADESYN